MSTPSISLQDSNQVLPRSYDDNGSVRTTGAMPSFTNGQKVVTTAGTPVQITSSSTTCKKLKIRALAANTGKIYIGSTSAQALSTVGYQLNASEEIDVDVTDVSLVWINGSVSGDGICYLYW